VNKTGLVVVWNAQADARNVCCTANLRLRLRFSTTIQSELLFKSGDHVSYVASTTSIAVYSNSLQAMQALLNAEKNRLVNR